MDSSTLPVSLVKRIIVGTYQQRDKDAFCGLFLSMPPVLVDQRGMPMSFPVGLEAWGY